MKCRFCSKCVEYRVQVKLVVEEVYPVSAVYGVKKDLRVWKELEVCGECVTLVEDMVGQQLEDLVELVEEVKKEELEESKE